ncbi:MAG TPA: YdcF family protein [Candidatus Aquilonibacter sp.]|nr:YdcF family protein [Candidatus Aquilonibacter sp.]
MPTGDRFSRYLVAFAIVVVFLSCGIFAFRNAGRWLIRQDPLSHADVILVLSGSMPYRAEEAAKVYLAGYAPEIWLTHPVSPASELASMGIHFVSDEEYDTEVLTHDGVPASAIHVLADQIVDTEQEVEEAAAEMRREGKSSVIIVTSREHTRRAGDLWRKLVGGRPKAIVHAAPEDPFDADHWWRNTRDAFAVVREYLGLLNVWTGLRIAPHPTG